MAEFTTKLGNTTIRIRGGSLLGGIVALVFGFVFGAVVGFLVWWIAAAAGLVLPLGWVALVFAVLGAAGFFRLSRDPRPA